MSTITPSKRGRKRNNDLPPNRARDVQRAFRARRAAHLEELHARVEVVEHENMILRQRLGMPPADRIPLGTGPTGQNKKPRTQYGSNQLTIDPAVSGITTKGGSPKSSSASPSPSSPVGSSLVRSDSISSTYTQSYGGPWDTPFASGSGGSQTHSQFTPSPPPYEDQKPMFTFASQPQVAAAGAGAGRPQVHHSTNPGVYSPTETESPFTSPTAPFQRPLSENYASMFSQHASLQHHQTSSSLFGAGYGHPTHAPAHMSHQQLNTAGDAGSGSLDNTIRLGYPDFAHRRANTNPDNSLRSTNATMSAAAATALLSEAPMMHTPTPRIHGHEQQFVPPRYEVDH